MRHDIVDQIMRYEDGHMDEAEEVEFFQHLVDSGLILHLQGHYQREAEHLVSLGLVTVPGF